MTVVAKWQHFGDPGTYIIPGVHFRSMSVCTAIGGKKFKDMAMIFDR